MKTKLIFFPLLALLALPAQAAINIFACEPEWAALALELGGDKVSIYAATQALQDPHRVEARPSLIAKMRNAQLVICSGAELETGWLPAVMREAGNARVQPGTPGNFEASQQVTRLEVPTRLDRADGDVHAGGNPHIHLDARNILAVAAPLAKRLGELDPASAAVYETRHKVFVDKWRAAIINWEKQAAPLKGAHVITQHKNLTYLLNWLGMSEVATIEPKPGMEPSSSHLAQLLERIKAQPPKLILRAAYDTPRPGEWLAEQSQIPLVTLPFTVGGSERAKDLFGLFDDTIAKLNAAR